MYVTATLVGAALAVSLLTATPARAEHMTLVPLGQQSERGEREAAKASTQSPSDLIDVDVKVGGGSFRIGARVFGSTGVWGAWINGESRPDGFGIDGRVQRPDRGYNFKLNAEIDKWTKRAVDLLVSP